jgi:hypothetical protein
MQFRHMIVGFGAVAFAAILASELSSTALRNFIFLTLLGTAMYAVIQRLRLKVTLRKNGPEESAVEARLVELDRRMTDVQEVMLAIHDKLEHHDELDRLERPRQERHLGESIP